MCCLLSHSKYSKPSLQLLGQLPLERLNPVTVFHQVGVDYAGPIMVKSGSPRKLFLNKAFVCAHVVHCRSVSLRTCIITDYGRLYSNLAKVYGTWRKAYRDFK